MEVNLSHLEDNAPEWDFVVTYDGVKYPTRRPTFGEIAEIQQTGRAGVYADVTRAFEAVFVDPKPVISGWPHAVALGAIRAFIKYAMDSAAAQMPAIDTQLNLARSGRLRGAR